MAARERREFFLGSKSTVRYTRPTRRTQEISFDVCDQYKIQGEVFSDAIISDREVPVSLEDAYKNTSIIEAIFESEKNKIWIEVQN